MNKLYEIKEKIVKSGNSKIFQNWNEHAGITVEDFLDGLRWLCDDPRDGGPCRNRLTRELGCSEKFGIHRLTRRYRDDGLVWFWDEDADQIWYTGNRNASISADDKI